MISLQQTRSAILVQIHGKIEESEPKFIDQISEVQERTTFRKRHMFY